MTIPVPWWGTSLGTATILSKSPNWGDKAKKIDPKTIFTLNKGHVQVNRNLMIKDFNIYLERYK